jgi:hypothetical protein
MKRHGVNVAANISARLAGIEAAAVVAGAGLAQAGAGHQVTTAGPHRHDLAADRRNVDEVPQNPFRRGCTGLPRLKVLPWGDLALAPTLAAGRLRHQGVDDIARNSS